MPGLFKLSPDAWQAYCLRNNCRYILWGADDLDSLILKHAPPFVVTLCKNVRFVVQRVDIGDFCLLYAYGGLYADLVVLPNRERYPHVTLGLCKMASRAQSQQSELEMEMFVASRGNPNLLQLLVHMKLATQVKCALQWYLDKPCRYIYNTTGPKSVAKFFKHSEHGRSILFFPMCRPIEKLDKQVLLDATGRIGGYDVSLKQYDVLSAFSMS